MDEGEESMTLTTTITSDADDKSHNIKCENYRLQIFEVVRQLLAEESMVDLTLCVAGERINAHRVVMSNCSSLFKEILCRVNEEHTTIILPGVEAQYVKAIIEFCYNGEIRIPYDDIGSFLEASHFLKIEGLKDIAGIVDENENSKEGEELEEYVLQDSNAINSDSNPEPVKQTTPKSNKSIKRRRLTSTDANELKRRKSVCKKEYTNEQLEKAINDIKSGCTLLEASAKNGIPRSTLYMRTKALGVPLSTSRSDYTLEDMRAAIQYVIEGSSLQQAADCYGIPKTVLWRRIQKEGHEIKNKRETRKNYGDERRLAAVKALERGDSLTKVANEYKIPKTTLFRDKARLVDQGKLPSTYCKRRKSEGDDQKRSRLEEAVAACKEGTMSQASASARYKIPKTTIWRRLQKELAKSSSPTKSPKKKTEPFKKKTPIKSEEFNEDDFEAYCPDEAEMNITYINEDNLSEDPVIILAGEDTEELNRQSYVVVREGSSEENLISLEYDSIR